MDTPGTDDILQRVLAHPAVVQLLQSEAAAAATSNGPITGAVPLNRDETLSATTVVFSGNFGTYRSKVTDVLIYATHVALLYTDRVGDEDLFFEPPVGQDFVLHVPARDPSQPSQIAVRHYGLTVRLPRFNATLVTFVRGAATATRGDMSDYDFGSDPIAGNTVRIDSNDLNGVNL